jgi:peptidoglycan hydrolase-like protein with peptidoglycan-binding domain
MAFAMLLASALMHAQGESATKPVHPVKKSSASHKASRRRRKSHKSASWRTRGQKKIDPERATQIQQALIREHYLTGKPSGTWDSATEQAMQRYQADHGWQAKTTPDSRALIQLGLGPDHKNLLNPESAMTTQPTSAHSAPAPNPTDPAESATSKQR